MGGLKNRYFRFLIFSCCIVFPTSGNALSCIGGKMTQEAFSKYDLIVKGKVLKILVKKNPSGFFLSIKVLKSWKGAKSGETVWIRYKEWGKKKAVGSYNTAGSYMVGKTYMIYTRKKSGEFVMGPCAGLDSSFRMSKKLKKFIESSPYIEKDSTDSLKSKFYGTPLYHYYEKCKNRPKDDKDCSFIHSQKPQLINVKGYNIKDLWGLLGKGYPKYAEDPLDKRSKSNIERLKVLVDSNREDVLDEMKKIFMLQKKSLKK